MFHLTFRIFQYLVFLGTDLFGHWSEKASNSQKKLITSGIYGLIRHPQFASGLIMLVDERPHRHGFNY